MKKILFFLFILLSCHQAYAWPDGSSWSEDVEFIVGGPTLPSACQAKQAFVLTSGTSGQQFYICEAGTWVLQGDGGGGGGGSGTVNTGAAGYFTYYPSAGTTVDDQTLLLLSGSNIGIGTTQPIGKLAVVGDEARIWTGAGSDNNALSSGELYVEGDLEVDGTVYATAFSGAPVAIGFAISDETTAITTGTAKITFRMPFAMTVTSVRASLNTVSSSGTPTFDIKESGTTIFSTKVTIDANELTSQTAATPAVLSDTSLADDAEMTVNIDTAGTGAKGAKIWIIGTR